MERGDDWVSDLYDNYSPDNSEVSTFGSELGSRAVEFGPAGVQA